MPEMFTVAYISLGCSSYRAAEKRFKSLYRSREGRANFRQNVRLLLTLKSLSIDKLADKAGVRLYVAENASLGRPLNFDAAVRLSEVLDVSLGTLLTQNLREVFFDAVKNIEPPLPLR